MDRSSFYPPRWRLLLMAGATGFFGGVGVLMAGSDVEFWAGFGAVLVVGFGAATGVLLVRALRPGPTVVIDADGITDRTTLLPTGLVRWDEIAAVRKREIGRGAGRERMLQVVLLDPDGFRDRRQGAAHRLVDRLRRLIGQPEVSIPGSMVSKPMAAVIAELHRWRPDLEVLELPPPRPGLFARLGRSKAYSPAKQHPDLPRW